MRTEIIATIDELNQYLEGNVTDEAVVSALTELLTKFQEEQTCECDVCHMDQEDYDFVDFYAQYD